MFDGTPDESLPEEDQMWAMEKYQEFIYRKFFHLSKEQMYQEPLEDFAVNVKLMELSAKRQRQETMVLEQKAKQR